MFRCIIVWQFQKVLYDMKYQITTISFIKRAINHKEWVFKKSIMLTWHKSYKRFFLMMHFPTFFNANHQSNFKMTDMIISHAKNKKMHKLWPQKNLEFLSIVEVSIHKSSQWTKLKNLLSQHTQRPYAFYEQWPLSGAVVCAISRKKIDNNCNSQPMFYISNVIWFFKIVIWTWFVEPFCHLSNENV